jgi:hypothetical protein
MERRSFLKGTIAGGVLLALGMKPEPKFRMMEPGVYYGETDYSMWVSSDQLETSRLMAEEMAKEIDNEILKSLKGSTGWAL